MPSAVHSLAIIGAGIAGLTAARRCQAGGLAVTVFDKGRSPGGRISSRHTDLNLRFDHGAQYFTVSDKRFEQQVGEWVEKGWVGEWTGRIVQLQAGQITDRPPQKRFVGVPRMSAIADGLSRELTVLCKTAISKITHELTGWTLRDDAGVSHGPFDSLILAIPGPQVASLLVNHPVAEECKKILMEPCWTVMVAFEDRIPVGFDGAFVEHSPLGWIARNSSKPGRTGELDHWVLQATPKWSEQHLESNPDQVIDDLLEAFAGSAGRTLPKTHLKIAHRWRYARGASPEGTTGFLHHAESKLSLIGDWLNDGRVEGAFLSGWEAAGSVLCQPVAQPD